MEGHNASSVSRRTGYQNGALTVIAALLGLMVVQGQGTPGQGFGPSVAAASSADEPDGGGRVNAAEQRKQIIAELARLNQAVARVESRLASGLAVKVTEMPEVKLSAPPPERDGSGR